MKRATLFAAALLSSVATLACERGIEVNGTVVVPADVQRLFSTDRPGEVLVDVGLTDGHIRLRAGVLCAPGDLPRTLTVRGFAFGCARDSATIAAWAASRVPGAVAACDGDDSMVFQDRPVLEGALAEARVEKPVSVSSSASSCHDGSVSFALTLGPVATP